MFDFITRELRGLNQVEDSCYFFKLDIKKVTEEQIIRNEHCKKLVWKLVEISDSQKHHEHIFRRKN